MGSHLKVLCVSVWLAVSFVASAASVATIAGDVDVSGAVNAVDIQFVVNGVLGINSQPSQDINYDRAVNAIDIQLVVNAVLGIVIDKDGDGLADNAEAVIGSDPQKPDTDGDGLGDLQEVIFGSDPSVAENGAEVPLDTFTIGAPSAGPGVVSEAIAHFRQRVLALGGPDLARTDPTKTTRILHAGVISQD